MVSECLLDKGMNGGMKEKAISLDRPGLFPGQEWRSPGKPERTHSEVPQVAVQ